jgi:hypothetical protein
MYRSVMCREVSGVGSQGWLGTVLSLMTRSGSTGPDEDPTEPSFANNNSMW